MSYPTFPYAASGRAGRAQAPRHLPRITTLQPEPIESHPTSYIKGASFLDI